jgi:hypothetical protein
MKLKNEEKTQNLGLVALAIGGGILLCEALFSGCAIQNPQKRGTMTIEDYGAKAMTENGDPLTDTGVYAKKNVPAEYAEGVEQGMMMVAKQEYWDEIHQQKFLPERFIYRSSPDVVGRKR